MRIKRTLLRTLLRAKPPASSSYQPFACLPYEILVAIYQYLDEDKEFKRACRLFYSVTHDYDAMATRLLIKHGRRFALYFAILNLAAPPVELLKRLLQHDALYPRSLAQAIAQRKPKCSKDSIAAAASRLPLSTQMMLSRTAVRLYGVDAVYSQDDMQTSLRAIASEQAPLDDGHFVPIFGRTVADDLPCSLLHFLKFAVQYPCVYQAQYGPVLAHDPDAQQRLWCSLLRTIFQRIRQDQPPLPIVSQVLQLPSMAGNSDPRFSLLALPVIDALRQFWLQYPHHFCDPELIDATLAEQMRQGVSARMLRIVCDDLYRCERDDLMHPILNSIRRRTSWQS
ncbi:hypothetical protein BCR43DRAFT_496833 [Syncephalastrum racemosum]|uniref:F-box domain-containing protein n=1 Tax=Syncephalastrum racemosum TaxID=13706 RepID=A0A1X2H4S2_SYNRA|nr:hypothetical protein BCR43DRAFT_496833 [Syncephalastrum racemosum]